MGDWFGSLLSAIIELPAKLLELLGDLLKSLFIPSDSFWDNTFKDFESIISSKIGTDGYASIMSSLQSATSGQIPNFSINLNGQSMTIIDMGFISNNLGILHTIIRAIVFALLIRYNINNVYKVIRKDNLSAGGGSDEE